MELKFNKLREDITIPEYTKDSNAILEIKTVGFTPKYDSSGKLVLVYHTGLSVEIPTGYVGLVFTESEISTKSLALTSGVMVIEPGNTEEITPMFKVTTDALPTIYKAEEVVARMMVIPTFEITPLLVDMPKLEKEETATEEVIEEVAAEEITN